MAIVAAVGIALAYLDTLDWLAEAKGEQFYIRKNSAIRGEKIRRAFNGSNIDELVKKFGVHRSTVYRELKRCDKESTDPVGYFFDRLEVGLSKERVEKREASLYEILKKIADLKAMRKFNLLRL